MLILAAALSLSLELKSLTGSSPSGPAATCNISTVSYRFVGQPGTRFRYAGDAYTVPTTGTIEVIASKKTEYEVAGKKLSLNVWPQDEFGTRTVPLPTIATN
jgi:hypothetical protein